MHPTVSVIIPAYNGDAFLADAVQSVLAQSYTDLELLIVDDCSPSDARKMIGRFSDPRVRWLFHERNQGAVAARRSGVLASKGDIIAFLDQDDLFHVDKLRMHVEFLERHPEIGVTYNSRFEIDGETGTIRSIWQPTATMTLADLVLGFPFSPSDTVLRRPLALHDDVWDQSYVSHDGEMIFNGGEIVLGGRLALAGARFAGVGRALNYRRYHPRRVFKGLASRCRAERRCQELILDDPRCSDDVRARRDEAFMNTYRIWAYYAFAQDETELGQSFLREAVRLVPSLLEGNPSVLVAFMADICAFDQSVDLEAQLRKIMAQFPPELYGFADQLMPALAGASFARGTQALLFDRPDEGLSDLRRATTLGASIGNDAIDRLTHQLLGYETEFGEAAAQRAADRLSAALEAVVGGAGRRLKAHFAINRAFQRYRHGDYAHVPAHVVQAIAYRPQLLWNRGVLSILLRSALRPPGASAGRP